MENITLGQIATWIGTIMTIAGFILAIFKWYQKWISNRLEDFEKRIMILEKDSAKNKEENTILLKGQLACLKGLKEQGCDGPVTLSINEIESYLLKKAHE